MIPKLKGGPYILFLAGPYIQGAITRNIWLHIKFADSLMDRGFVVFAPLLNHFQDVAFPRPAEDWYYSSISMVDRCDVLFRTEGPSEGADREEQLAGDLKIPVYRQLIDIDEDLKTGFLIYKIQKRREWQKCQEQKSN